MKTPAVTKAFISIALATMSLSIHATTLNTELLANGNAETGDTTGWNANGIETVSTSVPGQLAVPVGSSIGNWSFQGGLGSATSQTLSQSVHLDDLSALIDSGQLLANFSILLQSRSASGVHDLASGKLKFLNSSGQQLAQFAFNDSSVKIDIFDWSLVNYNAVTPVGTRTIEVVLDTSRDGGISTDAYFDNVSLAVSAVPEPSSLALAAIGVAVTLGAWRRRIRPPHKVGSEKV